MEDTTVADATSLERLAAKLDGNEYSTVIVSGQRVPCLRVVNRRAPQLTEDIYAGRGWFWWSWAERLAPSADVAAAATAVSRVLRAGARSM